MDKEERINEDFELVLRLPKTSRVESRKSVICKFLEEKCGFWKDGKKHVTHYKYFVENIEGGKRIYLKRPTFLNKGIDFQVWVENFDEKGDKRPSHKDIFEDLKKKQTENPRDMPKLIELINSVWSCEDPDNLTKETKAIKFSNGLPIEMLLKILKWLFIEQDVTYWNYDGRKMLRIAINKELGLPIDSFIR